MCSKNRVRSPPAFTYNQRTAAAAEAAANAAVAATDSAPLSFRGAGAGLPTAAEPADLVVTTVPGEYDDALLLCVTNMK